MDPNLLITTSAGIVGVFGAAHLILTYRGPKLLPRDRSVKEGMEATSMVITSQTSLWRAWIGFNASHSLGLIFFGLVYGYLAITQPALLAETAFLRILGVVVLLSYVVLAKLYWFITPLAGISLSLVLYVVGILLAR